MKREGLQTWILCIGNPLRGDDGNGLENRKFPGLEIQASHQLYIEMADSL
jgi:hypothetical protein